MELTISCIEHARHSTNAEGKFVNYKILILCLLLFVVFLVHCRNSISCVCVYKPNTHSRPVRTIYAMDSKRAFTYSRLHPHAPAIPQQSSPHYPWDVSQTTCTVKALSFVARNTDAHKTLCHLGLISSHPEQLWPKLSCVVVGRQRNAGRTALRAPTEGKL